MLGDMRREQALIQKRERRTHRQPDQENARKKTRGTPRRDSIRDGQAKVKPPAQIEGGGENCGEGNRNRHRPGGKNILKVVWHSALSLRNSGWRPAFFERCITRRHLPWRVQSRQECDPRRRLYRTPGFFIRR